LIDSEDEQMIRENMISREMKGSVTKTPEGIWAEITGKSAHASRPELGHNAASDLVKLIADLWHETSFEEFRDPDHGCNIL
jgi:acetylornithine deacetylase/succinyl-diaminopimelate desuccinylase-like protein